MDSLAVIIFTLLIATSGLLADGQTVDQNQVAEGPLTYQSGKNVHSTLSVFPIQHFSHKNTRESVPAGEFSVGNLTRNSLLVASLTIQSDSDGYGVLGYTESIDQVFTFIEIFDASEDGVSGGLVELIAGGVGSNQFELSVSPVSPDQPMRMYIAAYAENEQNGGRNYRFGKYRNDLIQLAWARIDNPGAPGEVTSLTYQTYVNGEIVYIQSQDLVHRGQGALYIAGGGPGVWDVIFWILSGHGEAVHRTIEVYGVPYF